MFFIFFLVLNISSDLILDRAHQEFENENYSKAIEILEENIDNNNAEIFYYLGFYCHYLANDSRPLIGYSEEFSDKVIQYLKKAIELDSTFGNAYYFLGTEYGSRAFDALKSRDFEKAKVEYLLLYQNNGLPKWAIEYARNVLNSCDQDAILFTRGDFLYNSIQYLQIIENYRKDITTIPFCYLIGCPWYIKVLKTGIPDILTKVDISLSEQQIMEVHPYKWDTRNIEIQVDDRILNKYLLDTDYKMIWKLTPDLFSNSRSYLSPHVAVFINIIESNAFKRPVYFSTGWFSQFFPDLKSNISLCGLVDKLLPFETDNTEFSINIEIYNEILLSGTSYKDLKDVEVHNMPRVSYILLNYHYQICILANYYFLNGDIEQIKEIYDFINKYLIITNLDISIYLECLEEMIN